MSWRIFTRICLKLNKKPLSYKIKDLEIRKDSAEEQIRTRKIFLDLKAKAINGEKLTEQEKEFFCQGVRLSILDDGLESDYPCCANPIFKIKYLYYFHDLTGGSVYQKPENGKLVNIPKEEAQRDLKYLINDANKWLIEIRKTNHSSQLMQQVSKETREQIKILDNSPEFKNDIYSKGTFRYKYKLWALLLMTKFVYLTCLEIIETLVVFPYTLVINSQSVEFDEFSLVHIIVRHYAELTKQYETGKSYHNVDFHPRQLALDLELIFKTIEGVEPIENINNVVIEFKSQLYEIWINERLKSKKGIGNVKILRLETFYPILEEDKRELIFKTYTCYTINYKLKYYKNTAGNNK